VANGKAKVLKPHGAVSIFNFHYCVPPEVVAQNYALEKPIGENETGFRGKADVLYRTEGWDFILAGGALYNNLDYSFTTKAPGGTVLDYTSPGGGSPALRKQLGILKRFIEGLEFIRMKPDPGLLKAGLPRGLEGWALGEEGRQYAVYLHGSLRKGEPLRADPRRLDLPLELPAGGYRAQWLNPRTGAVDPSVDFDHPGGPCRLASPEFTEDVALKVTRR
jgi:hypothetical protein